MIEERGEEAITVFGKNPTHCFAYKISVQKNFLSVLRRLLI